MQAVIQSPLINPCPRPLMPTRVAAGFPSPADDYLEGELDINDYLIRRPAATFFVRVEGDSMRGAGIHPGDVLVVDRSLEAADGQVVIAALEGDLTVKRFRRMGGRIILAPEQPGYEPIVLSPERDAIVWGVVVGVVRRL